MEENDLFTDTKPLEIKSHIDNLTRNLIKYCDYYHNKNESLISDEEYDQLFRELEELETHYPQYRWNNSPTNIVGATPISKLAQRQHTIPMLSLNNIFSNLAIDDRLIRHKELFQFNRRIYEKLGNAPEYIATPKYDGVAVNLTYTNGILDSALTRGDGFIGEDVTLNIKTVRNIPKILKLTNPPKLLEVRGEVLIKTADFLNFNITQKELGIKIYANPRNFTSGSIRQLDSSITASRPLHFFAYSIARVSESAKLNTFLQQLMYLKDAEFDIGENWVAICKDTDELIAYYETTFSNLNKMPFGIDGVVYKVNRIEDQVQLGFVSRAPKFAIAHKFPAKECESQILSIQVQVGRTGAITPIAKIIPILVGGVMISSISLHNQAEILRKDIRINDFVLVRRAGEVIPEIVKVLLEKRPTNTVQFTMPTHCPVCNSGLIRELDETIIRCSGGLFCTAQKKQSITHFTSRLAMNIDGLGEKLVAQLIDNKLINHVADIYKLNLEQLEELPRFGKKRASNLINAINNSKKTTLSRLIYALGIRHVGESTAKDLAAAFGSLDKMSTANITELMQVNDVGIIVAESIISFFAEYHNQEVIKELMHLGITYHISKSNNNYNKFISGYTFVVTGSLTNYTRDDIKAKIEELGGKVANSISKKTNYILVGINAGTKLDTAHKLGIPIISENDFENFLVEENS